MATYGPFMHNGAKPAVETGVELEDGGVVTMLQRLEWVDGYCPVCDGGQYDRSSENPGRVCKDYHFGHHEGCELRALLDQQGVGMTEEMKANIARLLNAEDQDLGKELAGARKELAKYMRLAEDRAREIDDLRQSLRMELRKVGS
jgi:hypothetical protein